jgi:hypothetical protein
MAGLHFQFNSDPFTLVEVDTSWRTLGLLKAPANHRFNMLLWGIHGRGTVNSDKPVRFRLIRVSTDGTGGTDKSSEIGKKNTAFPEAPTGVILVGPFSVEPTVSGNQLRGMLVHAQQPSDMPSLERCEYQLGGSERLALQWQNDTGTANLIFEFELHWEE